jgi:ketosteroid isomerase-like protein
MRWFVLAAFALTVVAACQPATDLTFDQKAAIADTVRQVSMDYLASVSTLDADSVFSFNMDSDEYAWSMDAVLSLDLETDKAAAAEKYAAASSAHVSLDTVRIAVLGPDAGVLSGAGAVVVTDTAGQTVEMALALTFVAARRDGRWVLLQGHSSHAPPRLIEGN